MNELPGNVMAFRCYLDAQPDFAMPDFSFSFPFITKYIWMIQGTSIEVLALCDVLMTFGSIVESVEDNIQGRSLILTDTEVICDVKSYTTAR